MLEELLYEVLGLNESDILPDIDLSHICVLYPLAHVAHFKDDCIDLLNEEWPRSNISRSITLDRCMNSSSLPISLVMVLRYPPCEDIVIGHSRLCKIPGRNEDVWVESIVIKKKVRGMGLGKVLMHLTEDFARKLNLSTLYLSTHDKQCFYKKCGYSNCAPVCTAGSGAGLLEGERFRKLREAMANTFIQEPNMKVVNKEQKSVKIVSDSKSVPPPPPPPPIFPAKVEVCNTEFLKKRL